VASLAATFGRGAMTNGWVDIKNADVILAMGGNPAENHPCGLKWTIEAKKTRNAKLVVVDPRFTRTAAVADVYAPIRPGTDIAFLNGIIRYALSTGRYHEEYVRIHTAGPYIVGEKYRFDEGLFSGFDAAKGEYDKSAWAYEPDPKTNGYQLDPTMKHPRCTLQLLKKHVDRYTPEMVERICGTPKDKFLEVAQVVTSTGNAQRVGTITYALGWTQHSVGVQIIRAAATLQLLLGNVGRPGGGVNALRGHSNIQGATDTAGTFEILTGYLATPRSELPDLQTYLKAVTPTTLNAQAWASVNYYSNYPKFMVSLLKALYGKAATKENDWGYQWLPKTDGNHSWLYIYDDMYRGKSQRAGGTEPAPEGLLTFGFNPVAVGPNTSKMINALSKLKWLVVGAQGIRRTRDVANPDRSVPASLRRIRGDGRQLHQLGAADPVEVEGDRRARRREDGPGGHLSHPAGRARALSEGRWRTPGAGLEPDLELQQSDQSGPGRGAEGDQRQGSHRSEGQGRQGDPGRRAAARWLRAIAR
jgi:formate dehydrogenase major subunit